MPDTADVYGVPADALTQLGMPAEATAAVQRMLDLEPGVPSFTRAAYDLEQRGDVTGAREALEGALEAAWSPSDVVFCRYRLGELAFDNGDPDEALSQYAQGLAVDPRDVMMLQGKAKVSFARGSCGRVAAGGSELVRRTPLPQLAHEYANLLRTAGRDPAAQFAVLERQFAPAPDDLAASAAAAARGDAGAGFRDR
ncbi:tetratricopeptide repeat protein, partial [Actinosynnema sp. NPDC023658]|uniref:tetratricopeptide repeat protein n=1 Tax=Actinosynnema sp. NPDC023658 TaxID=3155465 RepID=UPI003411DEDC